MLNNKRKCVIHEIRADTSRKLCFSYPWDETQILLFIFSSFQGFVAAKSWIVVVVVVVVVVAVVAVVLFHFGWLSHRKSHTKYKRRSAWLTRFFSIIQ